MIAEGTIFKIDGIEYIVTCTCRRLPADKRQKIVNVCRVEDAYDERCFLLADLRRKKKEGVAYGFTTIAKK